MEELGNINVKLSNTYLNSYVPNLELGDTVVVTIFLELPKEVAEGEKKEKERIQTYEGVIISQHLNTKLADSTITVRKMFQGGGIEKVFIVNSPWIKSIKITSKSKIRRGKLYYLRQRTGKSARLKRKVT